ncbi:hypothetical protein FRC03_010716, partial [Tulasnella sp. 419]
MELPPILEVEDPPSITFPVRPKTASFIEPDHTAITTTMIDHHIKEAQLHKQKDDTPRLGPTKLRAQTIDDNTHFWSTYDKVAGAYDKELLDGWNKSLDVLLIFAGLFSAINTAFIVESYKGLQPDPVDTTNALLQLLITHRNDNDTFSFQDMNLRSSSSSAVPVTSVFFTSLSFSLTAAFGAVTAKQWLTEYSHVGAMKALPIQGRMRQERYQGMERWHLRLVIELLPVFLQISLLLFLVGVIQFLWDLDRKVGILQLVLSVTGLALYVVTVVIGIAVPTSPFQTPFSRYIPLYLGKSWTKLASAILLAPFTLLGTARAMKAWFNGVSLAGILSFVRSYPPYTGTHPSINTYDEVERRVLNLHTGNTSADVTAAESVVWLLEQAEHPDVILAALDAVPRFPPRLISSLINKREGLLERLVVFHNGLLPIAETGRHNPQRWVKTWSNRAIVSGIALTHISFARMSDTYVMSMANSASIVERDLDSEPLA